MAPRSDAQMLDDASLPIAWSPRAEARQAPATVLVDVRWWKHCSRQLLHALGRRASRIYSLISELWVAGRWLLLKACATTLYAALGRTDSAERLVIRLGNILFRSAYPQELFADYDAYVAHMPADLRPYLDLWDPRRWLTDKVVLDLGAGLGQFADQLCRQGAACVVALDCQHAKLRHWLSRDPGGAAVVSSAAALPFHDSTFDTVFSHTVFEHLSDAAAALREIHRVLKPGGYAVLSVNYYHHRGGHHLFPYIHFPWAPWVVSEQSLCRYWSQRLAADQARGEMRFFAAGCKLRTLTDGAEIQLNKLTFDDFERLVEQVGLQIARRWSSEALSCLPLLSRLPQLKYFLQGTIYYVLAAHCQEPALTASAPAADSRTR